MKKRVVITGAGIISSIGTNLEEFWKNCLNAKSIVTKIPDEWLDYSDYNSKIWSPLPYINFPDKSNNRINRIEQKQLDNSSLMAIDASFQALDHAKIQYELIDVKRNTYSIKSMDNSRGGVFIGTGVGGISTLGYCFSNQVLSRQKQNLNNIIQKNKFEASVLNELNSISSKMIFPVRFNPFAVSMIMPNACSANLSIKLNLKGKNNTLCAACASGTVAIGYGYKAINSGELDFAVVGGTEYMYDEYGALFFAFDAIKALAKENGNMEKANRPFDKEHTGFLYSQGGSAILILEELDKALERKANIIAEIIGYNENSDGFNIMMIEESGKNIKEVINRALAEANLKPDNIDYINSHGTGTNLNDEVESRIIDDIFGSKPLINSTKSLIGHALGASGAIEAVVTALSIKNKTTHICKNLENPVRDLNFVRIAGEYPIKTAISQSFGFGGHNAVLVLKEYI